MALTLGANVTVVNGAAIHNMVESVRPAVINNVLCRAQGPTNEVLTRCLVADELLAVIELLIEQTYVDLLVGCLVTHRISRRSRDLSNMEGKMSGSLFGETVCD